MLSHDSGWRKSRDKKAQVDRIVSLTKLDRQYKKRLLILILICKDQETAFSPNENNLYGRYVLKEAKKES